MPYPGVPKEKEPKMERCVTKVMKTGKSKSSAIAICKTSIMSQQEPKEKEKPYKVVANADKHYIFSSSSKIDSSATGKLVKNIEIFKSGTFKGIEFKTSALDKMVANFHYLKSFDIFPNVPMRADHPGFWSAGEVDKIGGYVSDLRRIGKKLVADVRFTSEEMLKKVLDGSYISRSSEIGTYHDNDGTIYDPVLYGFAWVDIPAVEGLSPKFSFSKDKNIELINLNEENMGEENQFPPVEKSEDSEVEKTEEETEISAEKEESSDKAETTTEEKTDVEVENKEEEESEEKKEEVNAEENVELSKDNNAIDFAKAFPKEAAELESFRQSKLSNFVDSLIAMGKALPSMKEKELMFVKSLSIEQFEQYKSLKESSPTIVKFNDEQIIEGEESQNKPGSNSEKSPEEKADDILNEVK